jgi:hypothetical protein
MSDFYQILKRETIPKPDYQKIDNQENFDKKNIEVEGVEKVRLKKQTSPQIKKIKKNGRVKKNDQPEKKDPEIKLVKKNIINEFERNILSDEVANPVWLTMTETAKLGGVKKKTIKRALRGGLLKYRIVEKRYQINLRSAILYFHSRKKLWNKLENFGFGQYLKFWKD